MNFIHTKRLAVCLLFILDVTMSKTAHDLESNITITDTNLRRIEQDDNLLPEGIRYRIISGMEASIKDFPYMVSLQYMGMHLCGGTIVTELYVLTAAHCLVKPYDTKYITDPTTLHVISGQTILGLGEHQLREVKTLYIHSNYNEDSMNSDIALIQIFVRFKITPYTQLVHLSTNLDKEFTSFDYCTAIGWGQTSSNYKSASNSLQQIGLPPTTIEICREKFGSKLITNSNVCILSHEGGKDTCMGDSGGPLLCDDIQYGITSFGIGCAQPLIPGVFTRVASFTPWIENVIAGHLNEAQWRSISAENRANKWKIRYLLILISVLHFVC